MISQDGYMVSTLKRFNIVVESPATLFDVIDEMEDLRSGSPTVSELAFCPGHGQYCNLFAVALRFWT